MKLALIAMPRTGHRAVMEWMRREHGGFVKNIEGFDFDRSMKRAEIQGVDPWMLIRDYPNWVAGCLAHFGDFAPMPSMIDSWITHAEAADTIPTILYPDWVNAGHGAGIEGYESAFSDGSVLTRWKQMERNEIFQRYMKRGDALALNAKLFPEMEYAS